jgi:hypothetical protein
MRNLITFMWFFHSFAFIFLLLFHWFLKTDVCIFLNRNNCLVFVMKTMCVFCDVPTEMGTAVAQWLRYCATNQKVLVRSQMVS